MKEISGDDTIQCRKLFKDPECFEPQCQFVLVLNKMLDFSDEIGDYGFWRGIRCIDFKSKFTNKPTKIIQPKPD